MRYLYLSNKSFIREATVIITIIIIIINTWDQKFITYESGLYDYTVCRNCFLIQADALTMLLDNVRTNYLKTFM